MNNSTSAKLSELNQQFYKIKADAFNLTRHYQWRGWTRLFTYLNASNTNIASILDLGCGNGRFVQSLGPNLKNGFQYQGVDSSTELISFAKANNQQNNIRFTVNSIAEFLLNDTSKYDLIVLFGVLHHIAGFDNRAKLFQQLKSHLTASGKIVITIWNFDQLKLFTKRLDSNEVAKLGIDPTDLETNDYIMRWDNAQDAFRYCHLHTRQEVEKLCMQNDLKIEYEFMADGKNEKTNTYYILS
jgi:SAM-dependent methyltransferase